MASASSTSPAVGRALDILTYLASHARTVDAAAISRDLGIPRSSVYHIVNVLIERGFVGQVPEARGYTLWAAAFALSSAYGAHEELERLAKPIMRAIAERHQISVHLGILRGSNTLYLHKQAPSRVADPEPTLVTAVDVLLPAHLTANGRSMLAHLDHANIEALYPRPGDFVSRTGRGPRGLPELLTELAADRRRGWSEEIELVSPGLRSVGVAIFDLHSLPIAALSCTWRSRIAGRDAAPIIDALCEGAAEITRRLHGVRPSVR